MRFIFIGFLSFYFILPAEEPVFRAEDIQFFEKKIRPLLQDKCYKCHSHSVTSKKSLKGNLFLDSRIDIIQGGNSGPAALPGKAEESAILKYVTHEDIDERMPPKEKDWLTKKEIEDLKVWINKGMAWPKEARPSGAEGFRDLFDIHRRKEQHWAWNPLKAPEMPVNSKQFHDIDKLIDAGLASKKLSMNPPAAKETLLRRAYLDISGLLPTVKDIEDFKSDTSPEAFQKVIDKLLADKSYGERWARHWLDLVRYAESYGHEFDYNIDNAYQYRDMVIRSLNKDVTHDQWLKDHVAGDLLAKPRIDKETGLNDSLIATGQWFFFEASHAPVDVKEDEVLRLNNQIDTFTKSFLALTVACARCHDHKFDAITAKDFYALSGYLQSSRKQDALMDPTGKITAAKKQIEKLKSSTAEIEINLESLKYLKAAYEIFSAKPSSHTSGKNIVFEDFENGYGEWKTEGSAFGDRPLSEDYKTSHVVSNFSGKQYICSYHPYKAEGNPDDRTGSLSSPEFIIDSKYISFLVAGGNHKNKTCVNLQIGDKTVLSQTGFNSGDLREVTWNVQKWQGKKARIVLLDNQKGGWGHISADRFIFSDGPALFFKEPLTNTAKKYDLDPDILKNWVKEFKAAYSDDSHPLHLLAQSSDGNFNAAKEALRKKYQSLKEAEDKFRKNTTLLDDFSSDTYEHVRITGQAFSSIKTPGYIDSGELARQFQGVVRTKDFTIDGPLHIKISGKDITARVVVEDYFLDERNSLLFRGLIKKIDSDTPQWITIANDLPRYKGQRAHVEIIDHSQSGSFKVEEIRIGNGSPPPKTSNEEILKFSNSASIEDLLKNTIASNSFKNFLSSSKSLSKANNENDTQKQIDAIVSQIPQPVKAPALTDGFPVDNYVYDRGAHAKRGIDAPRAFLEALSGPTQSQSKNGSGRLELADKILKDGRHFLARVQVNRIWLHLFGRGIVPTPDDFGVLGMKPTHPELLDHLALKFIEFNWSNKKMIKYIMSSKVYQQSSKITNTTNEKTDPTNIYYHRAQVRRLEGEIIRDIILQSSSTLNRQMYGPSVPTHLTSFMTGRGRPGSGPVDGKGRRSIYQAVRRNFLNPFFLTFDFPIPAQSIGKRNSTNVPAQALSLLNDPFIIQQADIIAKQVEDMKKRKISSEEIINSYFVKLYSRTAMPGEIKILSPLLNDSGTIKQFIHILINKKEFSHVF